MVNSLSCSMAHGIFLDQGSNLCLLHWQVDSLPLSDKGSPSVDFLIAILTDMIFHCSFDLHFSISNTEHLFMCLWAILEFPDRSVGKESACNMDPDSIPGLGRSPGEGNSYPLQYSCLENFMDRGDWQATVQFCCLQL